MGLALALLGRVEEALDVTDKEPNHHARLHGLVVVHHLAGNQAQSDQYLEELKNSGAGPICSTHIGLMCVSAGNKGETMPNWWLATACSFRGEIDNAFEWLDKIPEGNRGYGWNEPWFRGLANDPRWVVLIDKYGIPREELDAIEFEIRLPDFVGNRYH